MNINLSCQASTFRPTSLLPTNKVSTLFYSCVTLPVTLHKFVLIHGLCNSTLSNAKDDRMPTQQDLRKI